VPLEWQQDTRLVESLFISEKKRQYNEGLKKLFGSRLNSKEEELLLLNSRRGDSTQKEEELAGVTASSGYNQQRVLVRAELFLEDQVLIF